ncbi:hypothetical protein [Saccharopolyspora mangrovi]|uniref:Uncharacterized protein n=1 Tax=Saccharopolyspora mangrovi TaxID=3082379 RepID=A0ABU6AKS4_9PSEU|nr:hypothetical protein [Saccharopolyspora sp. S2-29]MEB3371910.1 hypothetical protein [Saccharopolyspora sp. S2-29]
MFSSFWRSGFSTLVAVLVGSAAIALAAPWRELSNFGVGFVVGTFGIFGALAVYEIRELLTAWKTDAPTVAAEEDAFEHRIEELTRHLNRSQQLIEELTAEVRAKKTSLEQLTAEADEKQKLATIHADAAAAVEALFARKNEELVERLQRQSRFRAVISLLLSGVALALVVGVAGNYVFTWISTGQMPPVILP